jgi:hypothetical protein
MIVFPEPLHRPPLVCLPLPAVWVRAIVLALIMVFVLLLLRWGYGVETCLILVTGTGLLAIQLTAGVPRAEPSSA